LAIGWATFTSPSTFHSGMIAAATRPEPRANVAGIFIPPGTHAWCGRPWVTTSKTLPTLSSVTSAQIQEWTQSDDPKEWANESFKITESVTTKYCVMHDHSCDHPDGNVRIDQAYINANVPVVKEQLQKAGIRLAALLDKALGE